MGHGAPDQGEGIDETRARQARLIQAMRERGGHAISDICALLGGDGRYVLLMNAGPSSMVLTHGLDEAQADEVLRKAYQARSTIILPSQGVA